MDNKDLAMFFILFLIAILLTILLSGHQSVPRYIRFEEYTVQQGDDLWSIATAVLKRKGEVNQSDVQVLVKELRHHNGLYTDWINPGEVIYIPIER